MDQQELHLRQQVQDGRQAQECLEYLRPTLEAIRKCQLDRLTVNIHQEKLQDHLLDVRGQAMGAKAIEDGLKARINAGKIAENKLKAGEYNG